MSKLTNTLDKLKELRDRVETVATSTVEEPGSAGIEQSDPDLALALVRETSPIKERILCQFAKVSPSTELDKEGWLAGVRGKLVKTVDTGLEKYQEHQVEREKLRTMRGKESFGSLDLDPDPGDTETRRMSHSYSEVALHHSTSVTTTEEVQHRPHSQIFDFDTQEFNSFESELKSTTENSSPPLTETPTKSRKRFGIPSFLNRRQHGAVQEPSGSPTKNQDIEPKIETPKRTFRSLLSSYASSKAVSNTPDLSSSPPTELQLSCPQQETMLMDADDVVLVGTGIERNPLNETREMTPPSDVEEGMEAAELSLAPEEEMGQSTARPALITPSPPRVHAPPLMTELLSPLVIALLAVLNVLLPTWLAGFVTGLTLSMILTYWVMTYLFPPVTYDLTPPATIERPIEVHEPPMLLEAWMNLLPHQFHPYDLDTYEVRQTVSVRITVEHHMLKIEYPEWNIPKRLGPDEQIPTDLKFLFHSDHIDLSMAKISLLPEGIAGKRMFSKKYPIQIKTNALVRSEDKLSKIVTKRVKSAPVMSPADADSDNEDTFHDVDDFDSTSLDSMEELHDVKVFYLFARADREKEDLYKSLLDAHHFLSDTVLDVARREDAITEGIDREAGGRETVRERKTKFTDFMARVMDGQHRGGRVGEDERPQQLSDNDSHCLNFLNIFLNRVFYDIHKSEEIKALLKSRIYNKLLKIKITQWFKSIDLTEINMGSMLPHVSWIRNVHQNERGLWVELGLEYAGVASATIETCGFNLGEEGLKEEVGVVHLRDLLEVGGQEGEGLALHQHKGNMPGESGRKISSRIEAATNSDEEDSAEEDSEDSQELPVEQVVGAAVPDQAGLLRSRWWEVVGNSELVKSGINKLSNSEWWKQKTSKKITLHLEMTSLSGVLVLNIPPPPSDRLWYGFKSRPELGLRIVPYYGDSKLGDDSTFFSSAVNKGIGVLVNRLKEEIHKFVLLPNMDDLPIRIMDPFPTSNVEEEGPTNNLGEAVNEASSL